MGQITVEDADILVKMLDDIFDLALQKRNTYRYRNTTFNDNTLGVISTHINNRIVDLETKIKRDKLSMGVFYFNMEQMQKGIFKNDNLDVGDSMYSRVVARFNNFIVNISNINSQNEEKMLMQSRLAQMGEMISMIAHQWRQPLGAIAATSMNMKFSLLLKSFDLSTKEGRDELNISFMEELTEIEDYVENLTTTIDDFRNFYRPNKTASKVSFNTVVQKVMLIIGASIKNDGIEVIEEFCGDQSQDMHDNEVMQVIINILRNAQDNFIEKKIPSPQIKIKYQDNTLYISDNGGGIPEEIIEKIFDPYFSTKNQKNGTGLGLYMSKQIIEKHENGNLSVKNKNNGAEFTITIGNNK